MGFRPSASNTPSQGHSATGQIVRYLDRSYRVPPTAPSAGVDLATTSQEYRCSATTPKGLAARFDELPRPIRIDQAFIGSCANGKIEDLRIAADMMRGRKVASGVRFIVTPGSQAVFLQATREGLVETLVEAGAVVTNSTCGACMGYHMGVLAAGEVCITASTRNFRGRMGSPEAEICSCATATRTRPERSGRHRLPYRPSIHRPSDLAALSGLRQHARYKLIERHPFLLCLPRQPGVHRSWNTHDELSAVTTQRFSDGWFRNLTVSRPRSFEPCGDGSLRLTRCICLRCPPSRAAGKVTCFGNEALVFFAPENFQRIAGHF